MHKNHRKGNTARSVSNWGEDMGAVSRSGGVGAQSAGWAGRDTLGECSAALLGRPL